MKTAQRLSFAFLISGLFSLGVSAFTPFITPFLSANGHSNSHISYINSLGSLSIILITPFLASLSDKVGRKTIMFFALLIETIAIILLPYNGNATLTVAFLIAFQAAAAVIFNIIILSFIEDRIGGKKRGFFTGLNESIFSIGVFLGPIIGAYIISKSSFQNITKGSSLLFVTILCFILFLKETPKAISPGKFHLKQFSLFTELRHYLKNKTLRGIGILGIAMHFTTPAHYVFIPLFVIQELRLPTPYVGIVTAASISMGILQFVHGYICDRFDNRKIVVLGASISALSVFSIIFITNIWWLLLAVFVGSFGLSLWNTSAICAISTVGERINKEGESLGTYFSIAKSGALVSYIISGVYVSLFGLRNIFLLYGIVLTLGILNSLGSLFLRMNEGNPLFEKV